MRVGGQLQYYDLGKGRHTHTHDPPQESNHRNGPQEPNPQEPGPSSHQLLPTHVVVHVC